MEYLNQILQLSDKSKIIGEIYLIHNKKTNKNYVGQAVSHRKNHNKYRPFGYKGRFSDHISEALCNTKKKQCLYLNNSIRKYELEDFTVKLLMRCKMSHIDKMEIYFIKKYDSLYPNGYNLTSGGKGATYISHKIKNNKIKKKNNEIYKHTNDTKILIKNRLTSFYKNTDNRKIMSKKLQTAQDLKKLNKWKDMKIDKNNLNNYIFVHKKRVLIKISKVKITSFTGGTQDERKNRAIKFLKQLKDE